MCMAKFNYCSKAWKGDANVRVGQWGGMVMPHLGYDVGQQ